MQKSNVAVTCLHLPPNPALHVQSICLMHTVSFPTINVPVISWGGEVNFDVCRHELKIFMVLRNFSDTPQRITWPEFIMDSPEM